METISGNYMEETKPLFRLLRTEAFRFILVCFNHYSLQRELKADLQKRFPNRPFAEVDAAKTTYRQLADSYYSLGDGMFLIDNFEAVLADPEKYNGLNLHRDKLAQYPVALICFISPGAQALSARDIMEKMPDLWSFRSFMLDLKTDVTVTSPVDYSNDVLREGNRISTLGGYSAKEKRRELERLQDQLRKTSREDRTLQEILLRQVKDIQQDTGLYIGAIETIDTLINEYVDEAEETAILYGQKGDLLLTIGKIQDAIQTFTVSLEITLQSDKNKNLGAVYERIGTAYFELGDLLQAMKYFEQCNQLQDMLYREHPDNVDFKNGLAISYARLGEVESSFGNLERALTYYEHYRQLTEELQKSYPDNTKFKRNLAISYQFIGICHYFLGDLEQALICFEQFNLFEDELCQNNPRNVEFKNGLSVSYSWLGDIQTSLGNLVQALFYFRKFNQQEEELYHAYPDNVEFKNKLAISYLKLGNIQSRLGNIEQAKSCYETYNQLEKELCDTYPSNVDYKNGLAISLVKLGSLYLENQNNIAKTLSYFQQAEKLWSSLVASSPGYAEFKKHLDQIREEIAQTELKLKESLNTNTLAAS